MIVKFRPMQPEDKELFKSFIRSLPRKDNYYLLVDVHNDQAIDRWMEKIQSGETIGVVATKGERHGRLLQSKNQRPALDTPRR